LSSFSFFVEVFEYGSCLAKYGMMLGKTQDYLYGNEFLGAMGLFSFLLSGDARVPLGIRIIRDGEIAALPE